MMNVHKNNFLDGKARWRQKRHQNITSNKDFSPTSNTDTVPYTFLLYFFFHKYINLEYLRRNGTKLSAGDFYHDFNVCAVVAMSRLKIKFYEDSKLLFLLEEKILQKRIA